MRLPIELTKAYNKLSNETKDTITDIIIKEAMTEQQSYEFLIQYLKKS